MFQFPGLAFVTYVFSNKYLLIDLCYSKEMFLFHAQPQAAARPSHPARRRTHVYRTAARFVSQHQIARQIVLQQTILRNNRDRRWVAPFGNSRIKARSQLPKTYRSVPRPSSPLSAKASTECPYDT